MNYPRFSTTVSRPASRGEWLSQSAADVFQTDSGKQGGVLMSTYMEFHKRSIEQPDEFWSEQAQLIDWHKPPQQICDYSKPPFVKWFSGGETNLCYNAVDRHAAKRPNDRALIFVSTETNVEKIYSFAELK